VSPVSNGSTDRAVLDTAPSDTTDLPVDHEGAGIDPELLRVIRRVAHREHLFPGATTTRTTPFDRPVRRRPVSAVTRSARTGRGTTARKVTWS
jgi:hypothetical protein